jgi:hypothetical protein
MTWHLKTLKLRIFSTVFFMWFWESKMSNMSLIHINFEVNMGFVLCKVGTEFCTDFKRISHFNGHVMATSLSPQIPGLIPGQSTWDSCFLQWHWGYCFRPISIIPLALHVHLYAILTWRTPSMETFKKQYYFRYQAALDLRVLSLFFRLKWV